MKPIYIQLGGSIFLLVVVVGAFSMWYSLVQTQSARAVELAQQVKDKSQATTRVAQAREQLTRLAPEEAAINQYFVSPGDIVPFLEQYSLVGKYLGSQVDVVSVSASPGSPYGTLSLALKVSGPFESVMRTIGLIEYGPYDITTTSLSLDSAAGEGVNAHKTVWTASLMLKIGTQGQPATGANSRPKTITVPAQTTTSSGPTVL